VTVTDRELLKMVWHFTTGDGKDAFFFASSQQEAMVIRDGYNRNPATAPGVRVCSRPTDGILPNRLKTV